MADSDEENPRPSTNINTTSSHHHHNNSRTTTANPMDRDADLDGDLSEETQDFRFLSSFSTTTTTSPLSPPSSSSSSSSSSSGGDGGGGNPTLPRRGEKDFEPNPTKAQEAALRASRQAMHDALSVDRIHASKKGWVVGYFTGGAAAGSGGMIEEDGKRRDKRVGKCVVRVDAPRGPHFRTMGVSDARNRVWLLPEEALYLVERGSLDVRWAFPEGKEGERGGTAEDGDCGDGDGEGDDDVPPALSELPMSLQGAYATFISEDDLTLAKYTVFAGLRRGGYTVIRAPTWENNILPPSDASRQISRLPNNKKAVSSSTPSRTSYWFNWPSLRDFLARAIQLLGRLLPSNTYRRHPNSCPSLGPLVAPGLYRSYADIYRALTLIPFHDPLSSTPLPPTSEPTTKPSSMEAKPSQSLRPPLTSTIPPFRIHYHVYKPNTPFRKTSPPPPDSYLAVIDARSHPYLPSMTEIGTLLDEMPITDPMEDDRLKKARPEMRLKAGTRNVVLAVVDSGVVSFLRVAETGSGREKIYEGKGVGRRGGKGARREGGSRGGGGAGRGRGRGRLFGI